MITMSTRLVAGADAGVRLARPQAREQAELVPERDVHRAEAGADRRRDRALERDPVLADRVERLRRQRVAAGSLHHVCARLAQRPTRRRRPSPRGRGASPRSARARCRRRGSGSRGAPRRRTLSERPRAPVELDSARMADFQPGLEGVVAVETEIAEPDREGGSFATGASTSRSSSATTRTSASGACWSTTTSTP